VLLLGSILSFININKKGSKGQLLNIEDHSSLQPTPEASFDSDATNTIIPDSKEKSNPSDKKVRNNLPKRQIRVEEAL